MPNATGTTLEEVTAALGRPDLMHDRDGDTHYDVASALIKSLRGSDPDASLYWSARLLEGGEDPMFIARRLAIFAAEDVGNADPRALAIAVSGMDAVHRIGMPEARIVLGQVVTYLASAPNLEGGFPLRCFQRLSLPNVATLRCGWRHNRNTRGLSIPVLSY